MPIAITRRVSRSLARCELGYLDRQPIDVELAGRQHSAYEACLASVGFSVVSLDAEDHLPDAVFVEDTAVVLDEIAVMTRPGAASRRPEVESVARALAPHRPLDWIREPATLDGGDVMLAGRTLFVGRSARTNMEGIRQLSTLVEPYGYRIVPVSIRDCLHMKSACCFLGRGTILANRAWLDATPFADLRILEVARGEAWAANVLAIGETVIIPDRYPATAGMLQESGWIARPLDVSELMKAEAGVTCMSLILEDRP